MKGQDDRLEGRAEKAEELREKVFETILKYGLIKPGESVLVGVSGGPDSVCLLHVLNDLYRSGSLNIEKIYASHVNHMLRGTEADMDEAYVKELCSRLGIELFSISIDVKKISRDRGLSIEEGAREARYGWFKSLAEQIGNCKIAVAHNRNDQAETIIMNIIRGTGIDGLKGMDFKRGNIIRPLLNIGRDEIETYCRIYNLNPRIDSSNLESVYTRNKVRLELIPYILQNFNINVVESVNRMSELIRDDYSCLEGMADELYKECLLSVNLPALKAEENLPNPVKFVELDIKKIKRCHNAIRKRIIRKAIENVRGNLASIESIHVEKVLELCLEGRTGSRISLPGNMEARKSYNVLKICQVLIDEKIDKNSFSAEIKINIPGITYIEPLNACIESTVIDRNSFDFDVFKKLDNKSLIQFFDYDTLKEGIYIRGRKKGDIIFPYKCKGTKKLKDFFIDSKIPREEREKIPLVAKGKEIVWVIGYKISDKFKITENTKNILKLEFKKSSE